MKQSLITPILQDVLSGKKPALQQVNEALKRAESSNDFNAVISLMPERARQRAEAIDARIAAGEDQKTMGRLVGVPFIAKDNFLTFGGETTAASAMLRGFVAPYQATAVERLEAEGAICIGKANLDAFAHGGSTENSDFGPTLNPHDASRVAGGSSGGSAASVALGIVPFALGTDTGGSIRLPASYCGVVGYKPTYGRVSRFGVVAMASSTDVIGPLAHSVSDAALVYSLMAGQDERDATTLPTEPITAKIEPGTGLKTMRIGVIKQCMGDELDPSTKRAIDIKIEALKAAGHTVEVTSIPAVELALAVYYVVVPAEISSNLARYDGIRFGHTSSKAENLQETYEKSRSEGFNAENKRRIMIGNYVLSSGYYDAYYKRAQTVRTMLINEFKSAFEHYDALICPVAPAPAYKLGDKADPLAMYLVDVMTVGPSLAGLPAISLPCAVEDGLPVGLQIIGAFGQDATVLRCAASLEEA